MQNLRHVPVAVSYLNRKKNRSQWSGYIHGVISSFLQLKLQAEVCRKKWLKPEKSSDNLKKKNASEPSVRESRAHLSVLFLYL